MATKRTREQRDDDEALIREKKEIEANKEPQKRGRKGFLEEWEKSGEDNKIANKIFRIASKGTLRKDIRKKLNVSNGTWIKMMAQNGSKYKQALDAGELFGVEEVTNALKNSATGYSYNEVTEDERHGRKVVTKHALPNVKSMMFYLTNRDSKNWKNKNEYVQEITTTSIQKVDYSKLTPDEIKKIMGTMTPVDVIDNKKV